MRGAILAILGVLMAGPSALARLPRRDLYARQPRYQERGIERRNGEPKPLWGPNGPVLADCGNGTIADDSGLVSALAAIAYAPGGTEWLKTAIDQGEQYNGTYVQKANFHLFNATTPSTLTKYQNQEGRNPRVWKQSGTDDWVTVSYATDQMGNTPRPVWWVDGFERATIKFFKDYPSGKGADMWFAVLVNRDSVIESGLTQDQFYEIATHAPLSPVVLGTKSEVSHAWLQKNHDYTITKAAMVDNAQTLYLRDPFGDGTEKVLKLGDIMTNINCMHHFANYDELTWQQPI